MKPIDLEPHLTSITRVPGPLRFLVIGAGSRGNSYSRAVTNATQAVIHAVAEPDPYRRATFGKKYIWGDKTPSTGQQFQDWKDWFEWEIQRRKQAEEDADRQDAIPGVDGVFICTLDEMHVEVVKAIAPLKLHIMCEKPLATSLQDCLAASKALMSVSPIPEKIFAIGHVLRYSPHNKLLRELLLTDRVIGDIVSLEHTEPVGWSHFAHSYVRGNWRRETPGQDGSLLTKCCHDIDLILWLLSSPPPGSHVDHPYHLPKSISSMGSLTQFTRNRKPLAAGDATNCLSCPIEKDCNYSAIKLYDEMHLARGHTGWPVKIVQPDIEDLLKTSGMETARSQLYVSLSEDYDSQTTSAAEIASRSWYGRCVWESDNNVCDDQFVTISWDDDAKASGNTQNRGAKLATLHMIAPTQKQCERRGRVYGTLGELSYDSETITVSDFGTSKTQTIEVPKPPPTEPESHGGGDYGLTRAFVQAVDAVENQGWEASKAQAEILGVTLEEAVRSHVVVFAAEEARREGKVIDWNEWWKGKSATLSS
ncbi:hypothetical protein D8B26_003156 [Coccidioides posadasii str. Silveira]|uniref:NAD binding Rossmann fold oxidoreductase n=3 Tax=Coccidioides posadasii TaxID=199306 RepID=E9CZ24_COCPS|nr:Oxidoreductase family, NAD-binding Rossmann fold containing protein [Coccidioides posadasii C735 delta SOWgp]EER26464.1 Oxidoreductase family, NAD-binding Rossmann fold containing protein [Coccidioides posadasii C735 delta SOWgp]EFW20468.1 NAD binding Rossmann fold oxidoreductase [Coccidioides posadasii str. Silveira]KMM72964.1 streptomycin biosynthesis protein StrI [Coccidioides posadasii RMSCC 3488]QVM08466.1 hypothetical protein D8B26_003156 [Coccidioides posadasii str. Silveira]|eukprot:XP_003068609.1 Oxidoreductase family, NAD-binding Rossmann fold containing protein [Coccidioides posadasii C735 delta SOWgp]